MSCTELLSAINTSCPEVPKGYTCIGWIYNWDDIDKSSIVYNNSYVTFELLPQGNSYPIYDRSVKPFKGTKHESSQGDYYAKHKEVVSFPMLMNDPANAVAAKIIAENKVVVILENIVTGTDGESRYPVYGIVNGLRLTSEVSDSASDIAWLVELESTNAGCPAYFFYDESGSEATSLKLRYFGIGDSGFQRISGLYAGEYCKLSLDFDDSGENGASIMNNNGVELHSIGGVIDDQNGSNIGYISIIIHNSVSRITIGSDGQNENPPTPASDFVGILRTKDISSVSAYGCQYITGIMAENAEFIDADGCACTAVNIELMFKQIIDGGVTGGQLHLTGGANAHISGLSEKSVAYMSILDTRGWGIYIDA